MQMQRDIDMSQETTEKDSLTSCSQLWQALGYSDSVMAHGVDLVLRGVIAEDMTAKRE